MRQKSCSSPTSVTVSWSATRNCVYCVRRVDGSVVICRHSRRTVRPAAVTGHDARRRCTRYHARRPQQVPITSASSTCSDKRATAWHAGVGSCPCQGWGIPITTRRGAPFAPLFDVVWVPGVGGRSPKTGKHRKLCAARRGRTTRISKCPTRVSLHAARSLSAPPRALTPRTCGGFPALLFDAGAPRQCPASRRSRCWC